MTVMLTDTRLRVALGIVALAAAATVTLALVGWPGRLYRDSDYIQYYAGSRSLLEGATPYDHAWWAQFHARVGSQALSAPPRTGDLSKDWTTPYPLPTFVALLPFALFPLNIAEPVFAVSQVALIAGATLALVLALLRTPWRQAPLVLALVAASQPLWVLVAGGNVSGFPAAFFGLAIAASVARRPATAGVLLAGCLVKPHLFVLGAIALVFATLPQPRRRLLLGGLIGGAALVIPSFVLDPGWVVDWLRESGRLQQTSASNATGWTIARPFVADFGLWSTAIVGLAVVALALWAIRSRPPIGLLASAAMPVSVLVAPHGWSYDYIALLPTAVVGVGIASASQRRVLALVAVALTVVAVPWLLYIVAFQRNGEDLTAWLLIVAEAALIAASTRIQVSRPSRL